MHFARRAEGIKSARAIFKLAREDKRSSYHVFVAAALMEFYCSKVSKLGTHNHIRHPAQGRKRLIYMILALS